MTSYRSMRGGLIATTAIYVMAAASPAMAQSKSFNVPAQTAATGIPELARQADVQILVAESATRGKSIKPVRGTMTVDQALRRALSGTGLRVSSSDGRTFTLVGNAGGEQAPQDVTSSSLEEQSEKGVAEILVTGQRSLNVDVRRSEDAPQPYVVLGRDEIERSQATSVEAFLKTRLPMNASAGSMAETGSTVRGRSRIDLRGMGVNQTLILLNGRRLPSINLGYGGGASQPDISGVPLSAIERIEVLPTTASGIYGGGATGGVINIITRSNYQGFELGVSSGISSRGDAGSYRVDGTAGFSFDEGRTSILLTGSHSSSDPLYLRDRASTFERSWALLRQNDPTSISNFSDPRYPPVGYLTNIISANGSSLILDNGTPIGSSFTSVPAGYAGPASDGGAALARNAGTYSFGLPDDPGFARRGLRAASKSSAIAANVRTELSSALSGFAEFYWDDSRLTGYGNTVASRVLLAANAPTNPFTTPIYVSFPFTQSVRGNVEQSSRSETLRGVAGFILKLPQRWVTSADFSISRSRSTFRGYTASPVLIGDPDGAGPGISVTQALEQGLLDVVRDLNTFPLNWTPYLLPDPDSFIGPSDTISKSATVRLSGPITAIWGGDITFSGYGEWRQEDLKLSPGYNPRTATYTVRGPALQKTLSAYGELLFPLISDSNEIPFVKSLELQASARFDRITSNATSPGAVGGIVSLGSLPTWSFSRNFDEAVSFTIAGKYAISDDLFFRASYGTGFLPPSLNQIVESLSGAPQNRTYIDPRRGNIAQTSLVSRAGGGSPSLLSERSKSYSFGAKLTPGFLPGLTASVDYVHISKSNEIITPTEQLILNNEATLPGRVTRGPLTTADQALGYTGGPISFIDIRLLNGQTSTVESWDLQVDYSFKSDTIGDLRVYAIGTYQPSFKRRFIATADEFNFAGAGVGLKWRGNVGFSWNKGPISVDWNTQLYSSYLVYTADAPAGVRDAAIRRQGAPRVPSQTYSDLMVGFSIPMQDRARSMKLSLGVENIFDKEPPLIASNLPSDGAFYSTYGDIRRRRFTASVRAGF